MKTEPNNPHTAAGLPPLASAKEAHQIIEQLSKFFVGHSRHTANLLRILLAITDPNGDPARYALAQDVIARIEGQMQRGHFVQTEQFDNAFINWRRKHVDDAQPSDVP